MVSTDYLEKKINFVKQFANEIFAEAVDIVNINEDKYIKLLSDVEDFIKAKPDIDCLSDSSRTLTIEQEVGLRLFFGAVNYCFTHPYSKVEYKYISSEGVLVFRSRGFYTALSKFELDWKNIKSISSLSSEKWRTFIQVEHEEQLFEYNLRLEKLKEFSSYLQRCGFFSIQDLIKSIELNSDKLLKILVESQLFNDEFLKRAQATIYSIHSCLQKRTGLSLSKVEKLTFLADYRIPQLFYNYGVLEILNPELDWKLRNRVTLAKDCRFEKILRASAVILGEQIAHDLNKSQIYTDKVLWDFSQALIDENNMSKPHMLVPTDKY